ncbi:MAG TPA: hypothetical protein PK400_08615 [Phycisphaerales bacterium]|nr:hypothetical protein [Phycisphaerales bacterium]
MRCVLKSEAARWAVTRRNRLAEGANFIDAISPTDQTLIARAKALPDCYVWMLDPYGILPPEDQQLGIIDACYTNLADAAELMRRVAEGADDNALSGIDTESVASLVAEAQSALRVVLFDCGVRNDQDQLDAYRWLKEFTFREQIYLRRFMRIEDPASPHDWGDLHDRLDKVREQLDDAVVRGQRRKTLLNKARYHKRKLLGHAQIERADIDDWRKTLEAVDSLVGSGIHASDLELREILLPLIDHLPESLECGKNALLALREVDRYLASRPTALEIAPSGGEYSNEVLEAQELLKNKRVVLIGGDERSSAKESLERALALSELCWVSSKPHQAIRTFEPEVARQETVLVMLAIRWSSHSYTEVKQFCDRYSKLFVRLPGGYGVNQVAAQILAQAGDRLRQSSLTP